MISLVQTLAETDKILGIYEIVSGRPYPFMGTFVNPNFQAGFSGMAGLVALGLAGSRRYPRPVRAALAAAAAMAFTGVYVTLSRSGIVLLPLALILHAALLPDRSLRWRSMMLAITLVWLGASAYLVASDLGRELLSLVPWHESRNYSKLELWPVMVRILRDFWPLGIGPGAFPTVLPHYAPEMANRATFLAGENELLQLFVDFGLPGGLLLLFCGGWVLRRAIRPKMTPTTAGVLAALGYVLGQNLVDFSLQSPGIVLPVLALVAYLWNSKLAWAEAGEGRVSRRLQPRRVPGTVVGGLVLAVVAGAVLTFRHRSETLFEGAARLGAFLAPGGREGDAFPTVLAEALRNYPADCYLHALAAEHALHKGTEEGGSGAVLHHVNRALFLCPRLYEAHLLAGEFLRRMGHRAQADGEFLRALEDAPSREHRAKVFDAMAAAERDPADLRLVVEGSTRLCADLLAYLLDRGRNDLALGVVRAANLVGVVSPEGELESLTARSLHASGQLDLLRRHLDAVAWRHHDAVWFRIFRSRLEVGAGNPEGALALVREKRATTAEGPDLHRVVKEEARVLVQMGDADGITTLIGLGDAVAPLLPELYLMRGASHARAGRIAEALSDFRQAAQLRPRWAPPPLNVARIMEKHGRWDLAAAAYEQVVAFDPGNRAAREGLARVRARAREGEPGTAPAAATPAEEDWDPEFPEGR